MKKILLVMPLVVVVLAVAGAVLQARHRAELSAKAGVLYQKIQQDRVLEAQRFSQWQQLEPLLHKYEHRKPDYDMYLGLSYAVEQQLNDAINTQQADQRALEAVEKKLR